MKKKHGNVLLAVVIILAVLLVVAIALGAYFWGKSKNTTQEKPTITATPTISKAPSVKNTPTPSQVSEPKESPKKVVENFINYSVGTIPTASLDFNAARAYLPNDLKEEFSDDASFAARYYGYQEGPTSVEVVSENINGDDASVKANAFWGDMGQGWVFGLLKTDNVWQIIDFRSDGQ